MSAVRKKQNSSLNAANINMPDFGNITASEIRQECETILKSELFRKAPRMNRLLRFLVEKAISGEVEYTTEYAIGIEVFDRLSSSYDTNDDPVVRVQIGRLRSRLIEYYHTSTANDGIEISIPAGAYMPTIRQRRSKIDFDSQLPLFAIHPFKCITQHSEGEAFTNGLHNELVHHLFKVFGKIIIAKSIATPAYNNQATTCHRLEGYIQIEADFIKSSVRLIDTTTNCIVWSEQFNRDQSPSIALQEELALTICEGLKNHYHRDEYCQTR